MIYSFVLTPEGCHTTIISYPQNAIFILQSVSEIIIIGLKIKVKISLKSLQAGSTYVIFELEYVVSGKNLSIYEVRENNFPNGRISKYFSRPLFSIILGQF